MHQPAETTFPGDSRLLSGGVATFALAWAVVLGFNEFVPMWPAIVVISLLWAALHIQYDWTGILQIFVIGLFLGWMRWRSGSTLLTLLLHTLFNLEGTLETVLQIRFFS